MLGDARFARGHRRITRRPDGRDSAVFLLKIEGDTSAQARAIEALRSTLPVGRGSAVIVRGSPELRAQTDVWGPIGDGLTLMRAVKRQFDPAGILNPGRGPGGL